MKTKEQRNATQKIIDRIFKLNWQLDAPELSEAGTALIRLRKRLEEKMRREEEAE